MARCMTLAADLNQMHLIERETGRVVYGVADLPTHTIAADALRGLVADIFRAAGCDAGRGRAHRAVTWCRPTSRAMTATA